MKRIFYYNITYACNNNCKNCISTNVKRKTSRQVTIDDYIYIDSIYKISKNDVCTVSGGEPTLSPHFNDIVNFCYDKDATVVVYSNGRTLNELPQQILNKISRIIIPLYGCEQCHNEYVSSNNAFQQTINSIDNIIQYDKDKIEIKLLLDDRSSISKLIKDDVWNVISKNTHFSVTRVLKPDDKKCDESISYEGSEIVSFLLSLDKVVRLYDIPFCQLNHDLQKRMLSNLDTKIDYNPIVICGASDKRFKQFLFNKNTDYFEHCNKCPYQMLCVKIMQNYFCPVIYKDSTKIDIE